MHSHECLLVITMFLFMVSRSVVTCQTMLKHGDG